MRTAAGLATATALTAGLLFALAPAAWAQDARPDEPDAVAPAAPEPVPDPAAAPSPSSTPAAAEETTPLPEEDAEAAEASRTLVGADARFGPLVTIEAIEVVGNSSTSTLVIERALRFGRGEMLRTGDPRLTEARFKVLALGYFRDVTTRLRKGSERGRVVFVVDVVERGTVVLERFHLGTTNATPFWFGLDVSERNFFGTGVAVGGAFVVATEGRAMGAESQHAFELRLAKPALAGTHFGAHLSAIYVEASEPYRIAGALDHDDPRNEFAAFGYRRIGGRGGLNWDVSPLTRLAFDARVEHVDADVPENPTRTREDGSVAAVDLHLQRGNSRVISVAIGYDRDTRNDPVLTASGDHLRLYGELGSPLMGGSYEFGAVLARYERWWPIGKNQQHIVSLHLTGGLVLGDAPLFDRFYVGDMNRMIAPRALGLVVSTAPSRDFLGTGTEGVRYGEISGMAEVQYAYRLFRNRKYVYGGDIFIGTGLWALAERSNLRVRDRSLYRALPVDLLLDVGVRLDTEVGVFELSLANGIGRVPL